MDVISKYQDSKIIQGRYISIHIYIYFKNIVCILTWECNFLFFSYVRLHGTTKDAFVTNEIWLVFEHRQLFTHHHVAKDVEVVAKYHTNMGIPF
jgi:hypothetical protein